MSKPPFRPSEAATQHLQKVLADLKTFDLTNRATSVEIIHAQLKQVTAYSQIDAFKTQMSNYFRDIIQQKDSPAAVADRLNLGLTILKNVPSKYQEKIKGIVNDTLDTALSNPSLPNNKMAIGLLTSFVFEKKVDQKYGSEMYQKIKEKSNDDNLMRSLDPKFIQKYQPPTDDSSPKADLDDDLKYLPKKPGS